MKNTDSPPTTQHRQCMREIDYQIRSNRPLASIVSHEEQRVLDSLRIICQRDDHQWTLITWDISAGLSVKVGECELPDNPVMDQERVLKWFDELQQPATGKYIILVLKDYYKFLGFEGNCGQIESRVIRQLVNLSYDCVGRGKTILLTGAQLFLPIELEKTCAIIDWPLPEREHIQEKVTSLLGYAKDSPGLLAKKFKLEYKASEMDEIVRAFQGMTLSQIEYLCAYTMLRSQELDPTLIAGEKRRIIRASGLLDWIDVSSSLESVGGLHELKKWLGRRKGAFSEEARLYGLPENPKGLLLVGVQGCGKSMSAQAIAHYWNLPLLRLDMGKVFSGIVGSSEANIRSVIKVAESVSPCVTGDTQILLSNGTEITIEQLYHKKEITELTVMGMTNDKLLPVAVEAITRKTADELVRIDLMHGQLTTTPNHLHPVLCDGKILWKRADDLTIKDYIAMPRRMHGVKQTRNLIDYLPEDTRIYFSGATHLDKNANRCRKHRATNSGSDYIYLKSLKELDVDFSIFNLEKLARGPGGTASSVLHTIPYLNDEFFYMLGLVTSDGSIGKSRISFINTDLFLHEKFRLCIKSISGLDAKIRRNDTKKMPDLVGLSDSSTFKSCYTSYVNNSLLSAICKSLISRLLEFEEYQLKAWVAGMFDGDGCVSYIDNSPKVAISAKIKTTNDLTRRVLHRIGYQTTNKYGTNSYNIEITGINNVKRFSNEIKVYHPARSERLLKWAHISVNCAKDRTDCIPVGNLLKIAMRDCGMKTSDFAAASNSAISDYCNNVRHPSRIKLAAIVSEMKSRDVISPYVDELENLTQSEFMWSKICSVEIIHEQTYVYDLCCNEVHNFIANGFVTHNCVLWCDEMEKGMSGTASSNQTDGGTASRVMGSLLTWMQEKQQPVYVVATANDVSQLPPELLRKGRFDEIFFVDLPSAADRAEIFKIHIKRRDRNPEDFDIPLLVEKSPSCTGAEIEEAVISAMYESFHDNARELTTQDIVATLETTVPLAVTMKEKIDALREWSKTRARNASYVGYGQSDQSYFKEVETVRQSLMTNIENRHESKISESNAEDQEEL